MIIPAVAIESKSDEPLGALMSPGWRFIWDDSRATPGRMVVRFSIKVVPSPIAGQKHEGKQSDVLQIGLSRDPSTVQSCLTYGLNDSSVQRGPDRVIHGQTFTVWNSRQEEMNQVMTVTDLRTIEDGTCYAVERFSYLSMPTPLDQSVTTSDAAGAKALDIALASLRFQ